MPEEDPKTPEEIQAERMSESIAAGVREAMKPLVERVAAEREPEPVRQAAPAARVVPDSTSIDAEIDDAIANGRPVSGLLKKRDAIARASLERDVIDPIRAQGGAAIGSTARQLAAGNLSHYKKYKKEIDSMVSQWLNANPGAIESYDAYENAHRIVLGSHVDELLREDREEVIRQARETAAADLLPSGGRHDAEPEEKEATTLSELLAGDWKRELRAKGREGVPRTDDEELRKAGYKGGFKEFAADRKRMEAFEDEHPSLGLDQDWRCNKHELNGCKLCKDVNEGRWVDA